MKIPVLLTWLVALFQASLAYAGEPPYGQLLECVSASVAFRGISGGILQTQIFAQGCGAVACPGIAELGHASEMISSEAVWNLFATKCDLLCSPEARARFAAAPLDEKAPTLIAACGAKYYGATDRVAPLFSARWFALERIARGLASARAHATGKSVAALAEIQQMLKENAAQRWSQFELDLPASWQGHYRLPRATRTRELVDTCSSGNCADVYVILDGERLTMAHTPRAALTLDGIALTSEPFPGDAVQPSELPARLEKLRRLESSPPKKVLAKQPNEEKEEEIPDWLRAKPRASDATVKAIGQRGPLLLVDRQLAVARVAAILGALGENGGRLAVAAADGTVEQHEVLLTAKPIALTSAPRLVLTHDTIGFARSLEQAQAKGKLDDVVWLSAAAATVADLANALDIASAHKVRVVVVQNAE